MKKPEIVAWTAAALSGVGAAGAWIYGGYQADANQTSGAATTGDLGLLALLAVCLVTAFTLTLSRSKSKHVSIPTSHLAIAFVGGLASVVVLPAVLIPIAVIGYDLLFRNRKQQRATN